MTEISFSNSLIEAWWRALKHQWLYLNSLDTVSSLKRCVQFYVLCRCRHKTYHADLRIMPISVVECCSWWGSLAWSWHNHIASRKARIGSGGR